MNRILNSIKTYSGFIGLFSVIVILAIVFHYPIRIIDALTSEPIPDFGINISVWRIIFEPVIGVLLFYLRADQPLLEFIILLIWIISLSLVISFIPILITKDSNGFNAILYKFLAWLRKVPLIFCIWLGSLLVIYLCSPAGQHNCE